MRTRSVRRKFACSGHQASCSCVFGRVTVKSMSTRRQKQGAINSGCGTSQRSLSNPMPPVPGITGNLKSAPNGSWLDLDIHLDLDIQQGRKSDLLCALRSKVTVDAPARIWIAELAIPMSCLTPGFQPEAVWKANFFRVEGPEPARFYSAWRPTHTPQPNFHVSEVFGELLFSSK
jgi:hypothetical protein